VTLEPRAVVADWNIAEQRLTIYQGTQAPHMVQNIAALHLGLADSQVRVVCKDVGGSFGIKVHIYADEMATYALSKLLRRRRRRQDIVAGRLAVRLDAQGSVICQTSITEQGQGSESLTAQIVGSMLGVSMDRVRVILGDTDMTPYGGGTWASRGAGIGGEAALQATKILRKNILDVAAVILQSTPAELDMANNAVVNVSDGASRIELNELARIVYFRPDTLPPGIQPELMATRHFVPREYPFAFTNGVQASWLEVDVDTGFVKLLRHWVVEDCGTIINPQLVDEQIRGGVVQGLGAALFEKCIYDERGQLTNANMADYLVPMSGEMPDIDVGHVVSPTRESELGAKGAGEAGTAGAAAAVTNAVNDALKPFGTIITEIPLTPQVILTALGRI
jgi:carbon-monoxide dehydrogenase large subunit